MLDGWYCRTMANQQSIDQTNDQDEEQDANIGDSGSEDESQIVTVSNNINPRIDYKVQYNGLKKKLKFLLYVSALMIYSCLYAN